MAETTAKPTVSWASFVPNELIDGDATLRLTFNWLKGHGTIPPPPPPEGRLPEVVLLLVMTLVLPALMVGILCLFMDWRSVVWIGVVFAAVMLLLIYIYDNVWRPRPVPPPVQKDPAELIAWKAARTKPEFWQALVATNDQAGFTRECAELIAWFEQTQEVRIANAAGRADYGINVFALSARGRSVAQCPLNFPERPVDLVRCFSGGVSFFLARRGRLFSLKKIADGTSPVNLFATRMRLQYFDAFALAEWAKIAMYRPKGVPPSPDDGH